MNIFELRQYTLHPGRRDELIELFDRELVEPQEACGMVVLGQFRDLDDPDRFVWIRAFHDMPSRLRALTAFYDGPTWAEYGMQAASTMIDSSDARLLEPLSLDLDLPPRPPVHAPDPDTVLYAGDPDPGAFAVLATKDAPNDFPRLPIRTDPVVIALSRHEIPGGLRLAPTGRSLLR